MRELADSVGGSFKPLQSYRFKKWNTQEYLFTVANRFTSQLNEVEQLSLDTVGEAWEPDQVSYPDDAWRTLIEVYVANHEWKQLEEPYLSNFLSQRKGAYENRLADMYPWWYIQRIY